MTTFGDQLYQYGGVPVLSGMLTQGKVYHVNPYMGSAGNSGLQATEALKTVQSAHDLCTNATYNYDNDTVLLYANHTTGTYTTDYYLSTAPLVWSKSLTHLIGVGDQALFSQRARIAWSSATSASADKVLATFSGSSCKIANIQFFCGMDDANLSFNVLVSGNRNYFKNCHFAGIGHATNNASNAYSLKVSGSENVFEDCVIGLDTIIRTGANWELWITGGRNVFRNCVIVTYSETSGRTSVKIDNTAGDIRYQLFQNCTFIDYTTNLATGQTNVFDMPASGATAYLYLDKCTCFGGGAGGIGSAWADTDTSAFISSPIPHTAGGKALAVT